MYTLRRISGDGVQMNIALGGSYNYVGKEQSPVEFERTLTEIFKRLNEDIIYAFVSDQDGKNIYPLYSGQQAYIMTDSGKTFSNLTLKD